MSGAAVTAARRARLWERLAAAGVDALVITQPENRRYLSGFTGSEGAVVVGPGPCWLLVDFRYVEQGREEAPDCQLVRFERLEEGLRQVVEAAGVRRLGVEGAHVPVATFDRWREAVAPAELVPVGPVVEGLRAVKEPEELARIEAAVALADRAFSYILPRLRAGRTEREIALELEWFMRTEGAERVSFDPIVASGPRGALPHARPGPRPLSAGDFVILDFGCVAGGYCSDMTRTVVVGPPGPQHREIYEAVLAAQRRGIEAVRPGRNGREVDAEARAVIAAAGYGEHFGHGLGHGVGLAVHETPPRLSPTADDTPLEPGMVTSVEPGIYLPGFGGVRIEDLVVVTEAGCRVLSQAPRELIGVDARE